MCDTVTNVNSLLGNTITQQAREYQLTLNNWTENEYTKLKSYIVTKDFWILGKEIGKECGTPHIHIYIKHKTGIRWTTLKKLNSRLHIEKCKGDLYDNYKYCSKDGDFETNIKQEDLDKYIQKRKLKGLTLAKQVHIVMCLKYKQPLCEDCMRIWDSCRHMTLEDFRHTVKPWKGDEEKEKTSCFS